MVEHVVRGPPKVRFADAPLARGAEHDDLAAAHGGLLDDRPPGLTRRDHVRRELDLELRGDERRRLEHLVGLGPLVDEAGVERQVERYLDDEQTVDGRLLLGRQPAGQHHHPPLMREPVTGTRIWW